MSTNQINEALVGTSAAKKLPSLCCVWVIACTVCLSAVFAAAVPFKGPLRVHPQNPHYFTDNSGKAIFLSGSTIHGSVQKAYANPDFTAFLKAESKYHHNFTKLRVWENGWLRGDSTSWTPMLYERTGPGLATDGKPKFDLNRLNPEFFKLLRQRTVEARDHGIYCGLWFYLCYCVQNQGAHRDFWGGHPYFRDNNINGIDGDANGDGQGFEVHTLKIPAITRLQEAYVANVLETLNDLDNVVYEIGGELHLGATDFEYHFARFVKDTEAKLPKQHVVGITALGGGNLGRHADLINSPADWISPGGAEWINDPQVVENKIDLIDTDHCLGWGLPPVAWVWKGFTRGHNLVLMDHFDNPGIFNRNIQQLEVVRWNLGYALRYANKMNLAAMTPRSELATTKYCLADPGTEYLVYQPKAGEVFSVELTVGTYRYEWFNPAKGQIAGSGNVQAVGGKHQFTAPFAGEAVLYLFEDP